MKPLADRKTSLLFAVLCCCLHAPAAFAQTGGAPQVQQAVVAGGGGTSSNSNLRLDGTAGQSVTGTSSGGTYTVSSGFWPGTTPIASGISVNDVSATFGSSVTLTAKLNPGGLNVNNKLIAFTINGTTAGTATTDAAGVATLANVSLAGINAGTYPAAVAAQFAGDTSFLSSGGSGQLTVGKATPLLQVTGGTFTYDGQPHPAAASATGVNNVALTPLTLLYNGSPSVPVNAGNYAVTASFAGDQNYHPVANNQQSIIINRAATATALTSTSSQTGAAQPVSITARITSAAGTPAGAVQFKVDGADFGSPVALDASGAATFTTSGLSAGAHAVTADYLGDVNFNASTGTLSGGLAVGSLIEFSQSLYSVGERDGSVTITVRRTGDTTGALSVDYITDDGRIPSVLVPCSAVMGLALELCDYTRAAGTLHFAAGEAEKTFTVLVNDDSYVEGAETLQLVLSNPSGGAALGQQSAAKLQILDDAHESAGNPIDEARNFVIQHYHDFLNREPDDAGLKFWTNEIASCGADLQCREVKRANVSAAFFLSIEFQQTGYLVERMYKTAFGDATGSSTFAAAHQLAIPVVRLQELMRDTQEIGRGVVVLQDDWQTQLENNKRAFALGFVSRQKFAAALPPTLNAAQFVTQLDQNAGGVLSDADKAQLEGVFGGPAAITTDKSKRAQVLRAVAENATLQQREFNRAFVLMQYFGYLRRNPDDAQDTDYTGYDFWLRKLEQFQGDFVGAEMVRAFITSAEYRKRFGQ